MTSRRSNPPVPVRKSGPRSPRHGWQHGADRAASDRSRAGVALRTGLLVALTLAASSAADPGSDDPIAREVLELVQQQRERAGVPQYRPSEPLERVAAERARYVAGLPHSERLAVNEPIGARVEAAGVRFYRSVTMHLDMQRGYRHPASAFFRNWQKHSSWPKVLDPRFEAIGLATARGDDEWIVLVAVLLDELRLPTDLDEVSRKTFEAINGERVERGLPALVRVESLVEVALGHSRDMARRGYFDHASPEGQHVDDRARERGAGFSVIGENIYRCFGIEDPATAALDGWMHSKSHRENILDPRFVQTGIGVFADDAGNYFFTQVFAAP